MLCVMFKIVDIAHKYEAICFKKLFFPLSNLIRGFLKRDPIRVPNLVCQIRNLQE